MQTVWKFPCKLRARTLLRSRNRATHATEKCDKFWELPTCDTGRSAYASIYAARLTKTINYEFRQSRHNLRTQLQASTKLHAKSDVWLTVHRKFSVDKKNQLDVTFCIIYFSSNSSSTCFGQPCAHHQELTTAWRYSLVLVCAVAAPTRCHFLYSLFLF